MNLLELVKWAVVVVIGFSSIANIDEIQKQTFRAQARLIYESRTSTWGSPSFFANTNSKTQNEVKGGSRRNQNNN